MTRLCDGHQNKSCPRKNPCEGDCHFNNAGLGVAVEIDKRWLDEHHAETVLIFFSWALVAFVVCVMGATAYLIWRLL